MSICAIVTIPKFLEAAQSFGKAATIIVVEHRALRLVRNGVPVIGYSTPNSWEDERGEGDGEGKPEVEDEKSVYWRIGKETKYAVTGTNSIWMLLKADKILLAAPIKISDVKERLEPAKAAGIVIIPTKSFSVVCL